MLSIAVQRRFPRGLKVHVFSRASVSATSTYLADLTASFKKSQLSVSRCKVRAYGTAAHTFYLLAASGELPSRADVIQACQVRKVGEGLGVGG